MKLSFATFFLLCLSRTLAVTTSILQERQLQERHLHLVPRGPALARLGLTDTATEDDVRRKVKKIKVENHPDKYVNAPQKKREDASRLCADADNLGQDALWELEQIKMAKTSRPSQPENQGGPSRTQPHYAHQQQPFQPDSPPSSPDTTEEPPRQHSPGRGRHRDPSGRTARARPHAAHSHGRTRVSRTPSPAGSTSSTEYHRHSRTHQTRFPSRTRQPNSEQCSRYNGIIYEGYGEYWILENGRWQPVGLPDGPPQHTFPLPANAEVHVQYEYIEPRPGNRDPRREGNSAPRREGTNAPRRESNRAPRRESNRAPRREDNRGSRRGGNRASRGRGNREFSSIDSFLWNVVCTVIT